MQCLFLLTFVAGVFANMDCSIFGNNMHEYGHPESWSIVEDEYTKQFVTNVKDPKQDFKLAKMIAYKYVHNPDELLRDTNSLKWKLQNTVGWSQTKCAVFKIYTDYSKIATDFRMAWRPPCLDETKTGQRKQQRKKYNLLAFAMEWYFKEEAKKPPNPQIKTIGTFYHVESHICFDFQKQFKFKHELVFNGPLSTSEIVEGTTKFISEGSGQVIRFDLIPTKNAPYPPINVDKISGQANEYEWLFWNGHFTLPIFERVIVSGPFHSFIQNSIYNECSQFMTKLQSTLPVFDFDITAKDVDWRDVVIAFAKKKNEIKDFKKFMDHEHYDSEALLDDIGYHGDATKTDMMQTVLKSIQSLDLSKINMCIEWRFGNSFCFKWIVRNDKTLGPLFAVYGISFKYGMKIPDYGTKQYYEKLRTQTANIIEYSDKYDIGSGNINEYYYENKDFVATDLILFLVVGTLFCCVTFICGAVIGCMVAILIENIQKKSNYVNMV